MPQQYSITSSPRATSPFASESTLPCSAVRILAMSSRCSSRSLRIRKKVYVRPVDPVADVRDGLSRLLARFRDLGHAGLLRVRDQPSARSPILSTVKLL